MKTLWLILVYGNPPVAPPWYLPAMNDLKARCQLRVTLINNGQPFKAEALFPEPTLLHQTIDSPLALPQEQLLIKALSQPVPADSVLWLHDDVLLDGAGVARWAEGMGQEWSAIHPHFGPWEPGWDTRVQQEVALLKELRPAGAGLGDSPLATLPPCLFFPTASLPNILTWLRQGQPPDHLGCDQAVFAYHNPTCLTGRQPLSLPFAAALEQWESVRGISDLEALLERFPLSPRLYARLAKTAWPDHEPLRKWLPQALAQGLIYPEILDWLITVRPEASHLRDYLQACFPTYRAAPKPAQPPRQPVEPLPPLPARPTLAVALIVRDEEAMLPDCLASVQGFADQLVVVDTGSADRTAAMAADMGAQVFAFPWRDNFAAARNFALEQVTAEWVLVLDADERLDEAGRRFLNQFLWNNPPGLKVFCPRFFNYDEQGQVKWVHWYGRLFPNHPWLRYQGAIHEQIRCLYPFPGMETFLPGLVIHHYGYTTAQFQSKQKHARNLALLQQMRKQEPFDPIWAFHLGNTCHIMRDYPTARQHLAEALALWEERAETGFSPLHIAAGILYLDTLAKLGQFSTLLTEAETLAPLCQDMPDFWYVRGLAWRESTQEEQAEAAFWRCLAFRGQLDTLTGYYNPRQAEHYPLLQLMDSYRQRAWQETGTAALQQLLSILEQLLPLYPQGVYTPQERNLYFVLAQACMRYGLLTDQDPLALFPAADQAPAARQARTALLLLTGQLSAAQPRLAADALPEPVRVDEPWDWLNSLWQASSGPARLLAEGFLLAGSACWQDSQGYLYLAQLYLQAQDPGSALQALRDARRLFPCEATLCNNIGMLCFQLGMSQAAIQELEEALRLNPGFAEARANLEQVKEYVRTHVP